MSIFKYIVLPQKVKNVYLLSLLYLWNKLESIYKWGRSFSFWERIMPLLVAKRISDMRLSKGVSASEGQFMKMWKESTECRIDSERNRMRKEGLDLDDFKKTN